MVSQKQSGKSFEYAIITAITNVLGKDNVSPVDDSNLKIAHSDFQLLSKGTQGDQH